MRYLFRKILLSLHHTLLSAEQEQMKQVVFGGLLLWLAAVSCDVSWNQLALNFQCFSCKICDPESI